MDDPWKAWMPKQRQTMQQLLESLEAQGMQNMSVFDSANAMAQSAFNGDANATNMVLVRPDDEAHASIDTWATEALLPTMNMLLAFVMGRAFREHALHGGPPQRLEIRVAVEALD